MAQRARLSRKRRNEKGQTLIIALLVMGVLLILGFAFAQIIRQAVNNANTVKRGGIANDLAVSGAKFAHSQMLNSPPGADWRPVPTPPSSSGGFSRDPDAVYLRPGSGLTLPNGQVDLGGPDFDGPFSRLMTPEGRQLIRVSYTKDRFDAFAASGSGSLRRRGQARNYLVIESIGRSGGIDNAGRIDPTIVLDTPVQVSGFASGAQLEAAVGAAKGIDQRFNTQTKRVMAMADVGLTSSPLFITDKHRTGEVAELGFPQARSGAASVASNSSVGITFEGVPVTIPSLYGNPPSIEPLGGASNNWSEIPGFGGLVSNTSVKFHGDSRFFMNYSLGDGIRVKGDIIPADGDAGSTSSLRLSRIYYDSNSDQWRSDLFVYGSGVGSTVASPITLVGPAMSSDNPNYSTFAGIYRDGVIGTGREGSPRAIGVIEAPSIMAVDSATGRNRYEVLTRSTGPIGPQGLPIGEHGFGEGIYVDSPEQGGVADEDARRRLGGSRSMPNDWLNPNNASSLGWQGPYYIPNAPYLRLLPDGFEIIRDQRSTRNDWRSPVTGLGTGQSTCRYQIREVLTTRADGGTYRQFFIINSIINPGLVGNPAASDSDFRNFGTPFNGVLMFAGDVRVRGVIPTDAQVSVVSSGSIYIEGSITKGLVNATGTRGAITNTVITSASRSSLILMARDYVTVNTTMFFGPAPGQSPAAKTAGLAADTPMPIELDLSNNTNVTLTTEFLVGPDAALSSPNNPSTWQPYANSYVSAGSGSLPIPVQMYLRTSADDNGPGFMRAGIRPLSFAQPGMPGWQSYLFDSYRDFNGDAIVENHNAASAFFAGPPATIPVHGMGDPTINAYPRFESVPHTLLASTSTLVGRRLTAATASQGAFQAALQDPTLINVSMTQVGSAAPKNVLIARSAVAPHDVVIEAAVYAEEGSFFVIPGPWYNTNADDNRGDFEAGVGAYSGLSTPVEKNLRRYTRFGHAPQVPFFQEPLAVRVRIRGAISENLPAPMSQQAEWKRKWGWIPRTIGSTGVQVPQQWVPFGFDPAVPGTVLPNFSVTFDPALALGSAGGVSLRRDEYGRNLPPMPRMPVSPTLAYVGDPNS